MTAVLLTAAMAWWVSLAVLPWSSPRTVWKARPPWKAVSIASAWLVPLLLLLPRVQLDGQRLISAWFIALALCRAVCKLLLWQGGSVLNTADANALLAVLLIVTACIPLLTRPSMWPSRVNDGIPEDVWSEDPCSLLRLHCVLWLLSHITAWLYTLVKLLVRVVRYRHICGSAERRRQHCPGGPSFKVLIIHASVGAGHRRAAEALQQAFAAARPDCETIVVDVIDLTGRWFERVYKTTYLRLVDSSWGTHVMAFLFDLENREPPGFMKFLLEGIFMLNFLEFLYKHDCDLVVHTHFLSQEFVAMLRRSRHYWIPHVTVVTDFDAHAYWTVRPVERWFVAREETMAQLGFHGVPADSVSVTGIPIAPAFSACPERDECLKELGLCGRAPVVLLLSFGPRLAEAYNQLLGVREPIRLVVLTGRQADVREELARVETPSRHRVLLQGFTTVMERYMRCADIVVTKPGGLTTSECLASGCAMVVLSPYPGQESRNCDMLLEAGCATKCNDLFVLGHKVEELVCNPKRLTEMKRRALQLGRPRAAFDIVEHCAAIVGTACPSSSGSDDIFSDDSSDEGFLEDSLTPKSQWAWLSASDTDAGP